MAIMLAQCAAGPLIALRLCLAPWALRCVSRTLLLQLCLQGTWLNCESHVPRGPAARTSALAWASKFLKLLRNSSVSLRAA
jgi:hypothetical protein